MYVSYVRMYVCVHACMYLIEREAVEGGAEVVRFGESARAALDSNAVLRQQQLSKAVIIEQISINRINAKQRAQRFAAGGALRQRLQLQLQKSC